MEFEENLNNSKKEFDSSFESEISSLIIEDNNIFNIVNSINLVLTELVEINNKNENNLNSNENDIFNSKSIPNISILDYLNRIIEFSNIEENTLIAGLIYINKIEKIIKITKYNIHKILQKEELLQLELNISILLDFKFFICRNGFGWKTIKI